MKDDYFTLSKKLENNEDFLKTHKNGGEGRHQKTSSSTQADPCFHLQNGKPAPDIEALNLSYSGLAISMSQGSFRSGMSAIVFLLR